MTNTSPRLAIPPSMSSSPPMAPVMEEAEPTVNREAPRRAETGAGGDGGVEEIDMAAASDDEYSADDDGSEYEEEVEDMDEDDDKEEGEFSQSAQIAENIVEAAFLEVDGVEGMHPTGHAICSVCMDPWTCDGGHRICCIPCGHVYGRSCLEKWLRRAGNRSAKVCEDKCPQCGQQFEEKLINNLYAPGNLWEGCVLSQEVNRHVRKALIHVTTEYIKLGSAYKEQEESKLAKLITTTNAELASMKARMRKMAEKDGVAPIELVEFVEQNCPQLPPTI